MRRVATVARLHDALTRRCQSRTSDAALFSATWRSCATGQAAEAPREWLTDNMAAVLTGVGQLNLMPWALPATPPHGHVRIAMQRVGICGSDVHYWKHGRIGNFQVSSPLVLGHEASGEVVQLGGGVLSPRVGTRVALEPGVPCWQSVLAREGRYNLDPDIVFAATPPHHGSLCSFVDHPADWCYALPPSMSYEEGAFCEPLSVGIHAVRRGGVGPGKRVAVLGAGPIGLMALMSARVFGADRVVVSDLEEAKLEVARNQGVRPISVSVSLARLWCARFLLVVVLTQCRVQAHDAILVSRDDTPEVTAERLRAALGAPPDVVIDCCGFDGTMHAALLTCNRCVQLACWLLGTPALSAPLLYSGGKVVLVGMGNSSTMRLPMSAAAIKEVDIVGCFRYASACCTSRRLLFALLLMRCSITC